MTSWRGFGHRAGDLDPDDIAKQSGVTDGLGRKGALFFVALAPVGAGARGYFALRAQYAALARYVLASRRPRRARCEHTRARFWTERHAANLDAEVKAFSEIISDFRRKQFPNGSFDIVGQAEKFDRPRFGIVNRAARAIVVIARLSHGSDCDEIFLVGFESYRRRRYVNGIAFCERKGFREMGVPDKGDVVEVVEMGQQLEGLLDEKDVIEFGRFEGGAMAYREPRRVLVQVGQIAQPFHVLFA